MKEICRDVKGRKIYFAPVGKISKFYDESIDFINKIFGIKPEDIVFLSNESSLYEFLGNKNYDKSMQNVIKKVKKIYGVDISHIKNKRIINIIRLIEKVKKV